MPAYAFDTITAEQALAIRAGDTLTFNGGPARHVSVVYQAYDPLALTPELPRIFITYEGRTVAFATEITELSRVGALVMADGSRLVIGDTGDNREAGSTGSDALYGGPGHDTLSGGSGDDLVHGNTGDDVLSGGEGADTLLGGQGDDVIYASRDVGGAPGEAGDWIHGNLGDDEIVGGAGGDTLLGGQGNDFIGGRDGDDFATGDLGDDELHGGLGNDTLVGGAGADTLQGGFGSDSLSGGDGHDQLVSQGPTSTTLSGGAGDDTLVAASGGRDVLSGGAGGDRFEVVAKSVPAEGQDDIIADWDVSDTLAFPAVSALTISSILPRQYSEFVATSYNEARAIANEHIAETGAVWVSAQVGNDVFVFADTGDPADGADVAVVLVGRTLADISLANFAS